MNSLLVGSIQPPAIEGLRLSGVGGWVAFSGLRGHPIGSYLPCYTMPVCFLKASQCWVHVCELTDEWTARRPSPHMCVPRCELKEALG